MGVQGIHRKAQPAVAVRRFTALIAVAAMLVTVPAAHSQQTSPRQTEKTDKSAQTPGEWVKKPEPPPPPDIVSDNLDRVSATAEQILQIVDRDPGMMVELKQRLAEDAGQNGQILEETDLTDAAISDRLRQDLHARVLATRLLQRYGYLLPKVNPDSELAAEHSLEMRARVQELERASESPGPDRTAPQTVITVGSPPASEASPNRRRTRQSLNDENGVLNAISPETIPPTSENHLSLVKAGGREPASSALAERANPPLPAEAVAAGSNDMPLSPAPRPPRAAPVPIAEVAPVRMERRPNPYADIPSLYDLYVQANARPSSWKNLGSRFSATARRTRTRCPWTFPLGPTMWLVRATAYPSTCGEAFLGSASPAGPSTATPTEITSVRLAFQGSYPEGGAFCGPKDLNLCVILAALVDTQTCLRHLLENKPHIYH